MPIRIPDDLPAAGILKSENIFTMSESRASHQHIRPLRVLILNLMPKKIETETQLMRLLSNTPLQVDVELLRVDARASRNTPQEHLDKFYGDFERVKDQKWDGFIITGAPLGKIPFEDVYYWDKFTEIVEWSRHNVTSTLFLCWAAQAALKYLYDFDKTTRDSKLSGIYLHRTYDHHHPLVRGFDDEFWAPLSRFAEFNSEELAEKSDLTIFADAPDAGVYLAASPDCRQVYISGHPEYDANTLNNEYLRDQDEGLDPVLPVNYYPGDDENEIPRAIWRSHGNLLYSNWLNYCVYQVTPYDLAELK
ncbi:homoserine O-acetyltransferase MetA [Psychromonas ossibalaenae]|uniref:homoserine O-acetyltransferase MetA n=1 Tax=Psychromonas ossibalaenae TaxID=444922 RepID=UPI00037A6580|nr:homoserine O-succinyltransferase [Psychromonas ossibalaenae]